MRNITIKLPKMLLILSEQELMQTLAAAPDVFRKAIGRGKAELRATATARRQAIGFDRWHLYEELKHGSFDQQLIRWVEGMSAEEAKIGLLEYMEHKCAITTCRKDEKNEI